MSEPDSGLDTTSLRTRAVRRGGDWVVNGRKVWISTAQVADKILLLTRTRDPEPGEPKDAGLTLFFTDLDRSRIVVREIEKLGRAAVDSNELFIDDLVVPDRHRVGDEGRGFRLLLDGLNPERLLVASEAVGIGRAALALAVDYAKVRQVFGRPIGQNQGVQFPLAESYARLEAVWLMILRGDRQCIRRGRALGRGRRLIGLVIHNAVLFPGSRIAESTKTLARLTFRVRRAGSLIVTGSWRLAGWSVAVAAITTGRPAVGTWPWRP